MNATRAEPFTASPIAALIQFYERLEQDPERMIAPFGYSVQRVSFCIVLEPDGSLCDIQDERITEGNKSYSKQLTLPGQSKPPGQGVNPCFMWDNTAYLLGYKPEDPKPERTAESFEAFRRLHLQREADINDPEYSAVCRFLEKWEPAKAGKYPKLEDLSQGFGVFRLRNRTHFVHEKEKINAWWLSHHQKESKNESREGLSLLTGDLEPLARLHEPKIKGVTGSQSMGALLVSFNDNAYESYGKSQGYNAPIGSHDAFKYCTALNYLLDNRGHRIGLGDTTTVFWASKDSSAEAEEFFFAIFSESTTGEDEESAESAEHAITLKRVESFLQAARDGRLGDLLDDPEAPFYILGLSPNSSRLSVRFWLRGSVRFFSENVARHVENLRIIGKPEDRPPLVIRGLIHEAMPNADSDSQKKQVANLTGEFIRAVLNGQNYPKTIYDALLRRIRMDKEINYRRAALLRAYLNRNRKILSKEEKITMALNPEHPDEAYQMGRLFAVLEKTQEDVSGRSLNVGIKQKYFTAASSTPASIIPRVLDLHQHHLRKMENPGFRHVRERLVGEICERINGFPRHLSLEKQGLFQIGYYHQRQHLFSKKTDVDDQESNPNMKKENSDAQ